MKIKCVFFDQDETLIHPDTGLYKLYVLERAKDFAKVFKINDLEEAKRLAFKMKIEKAEDSTIKLYDLMDIPRSVWYDKMNKIEVTQFLKPDANLKEFLIKLKKAHLLVCLLTNSPTIQTEKIIQAVGLSENYFDEVFTWKEDQEPPKPFKEPFLSVLDKYDLKPNQCLMVGNEIKVDLAMAHSLGIHTVGINLETPQDQNVDFTINKLDDIFSIIKQLEEQS